MQGETKKCQNCKKDFVIEPEDFSFYQKIKVPPPTFCSQCRTIRRLCFRNEMSFFKRKCDAPGHDEMLISVFHPDEKLVVYDINYWWGDKWDPASYGKEYDFSRPFFAQWKELRDRFPLQNLSNSKANNSDYCNVAEESKDSYMCSGSWRIEHSFYSNRITDAKDSSDLYVVNRSELSYDNVICSDCYRLFYSLNCRNCIDSYFLYDCVGCNNCFGCTNLRNKSYCMWNKQLSRDEYNEKISELNLKDYTEVTKLKQKFNDFYLKSMHRFANQIKVVDSTGDNIIGVKNCKNCFDATGVMEDIKYSHWLAVSAKDVYDSGPGIGLAELAYECFDTGAGNFRSLFSNVVYYSNEVEYSFNCYSCSNLFGCIGLKSKNYCIFNKQYSKEEYEILVEKIKKHMNEMPYIDKNGNVYKYGEFFPSELSPFAYNETVAQDYFPLKKDEALKAGYKWRDRKTREYNITLKAEDLPGNLENAPQSIAKEIIGCLHAGKCEDRCVLAFKITEEELNLYKRLEVPLPRLCFGCRHDERLRKRNPMRLWRRFCMCKMKDHFHGEGKCEVEFETPYAPGRPEIIYCERCYNAGVY